VGQHRDFPAGFGDHAAFEFLEPVGKHALPAAVNQKLTVILFGEFQRGPADDLLPPVSEHVAEGLIDIGDAVVFIQQQEPLGGALDDAPVFDFAFVHLSFGPDALQFGRGPVAEDPDDRLGPLVFGHRLGVQHRQVAQHLAVFVHQGHAHIAGRPDVLNIGVFREILRNVVGIAHQLIVGDHPFAGRAFDVHRHVADHAAVDPEGQRVELPGVFQGFGHPGAVSVQRPGQVDHQGFEKLLAGGCGRAFQDEAQSRVFVGNSQGVPAVLLFGLDRSVQCGIHNRFLWLRNFSFAIGFREAG